MFKKFNKQEIFIPKNPKKYIGKYPISIKSSWERLYAQWLDVNPNIIKWSSENIYINYYDPIQMKNRRYYPDFFQCVLNKDGNIDKYIIEIKPKHETSTPKKTNGKSKKTMLFQESTYLTNQAKWKAADAYCKKMKYIFKILTEDTLFNKKRINYKSYKINKKL